MDVSFDEKRLIELYRQLIPLHKENIMLCVANYAKHDNPVLAGCDDKTVDDRGGHNRPRVINLVERRATI